MAGVSEGARATAGAAAADSDRMRSLMELVSVVTASRDYDDLLHVMAEESCHALGASAVSLSLWQRDRGVIKTLVNVGELGLHQDQHPVDEVYGLGDHPFAVRMLTEGSGYVQQLGEPDGDPAVQRILAAEGKVSALAVPVHLDGRVWGELWATRDSSLPAYSWTDLDFGRLVAAQVGAGIAQAEHLARVERMVYTDELTSLANRRAFDDHLDVAFARRRDTGAEVGVLVVDVNGLKQINDQRGHDEGDRALRAFADELHSAVLSVPGTVAARLGGDEFCALGVDVPRERFLALAHDVSRRAYEVLELGAACGVALTSDLGAAASSPARLLRAADAAQYRAKRSQARLPEVAGARVVDADLEEDPDSPDRRVFRGRGLRGPLALLDDVIARLDDVPDLDPAGRLVVVASALAETADAAGWFVSRVMRDLGTIETVADSVARVTDAHDAARFFEVDEFPVEQYPASYAAATGQVVVVDVDDPRSDAQELALLLAGGLQELVMSGGADVEDKQWLVEVVGDELSAPLAPYATVLRAAIAVALRR